MRQDVEEQVPSKLLEMSSVYNFTHSFFLIMESINAFDPFKSRRRQTVA